MPPKTDLKTLEAKRDNAVRSLYEFIEEFEAIFAVQPHPERLEAAFEQIEAKYRSVKKQQEVIADRLVDDSSGTESGSASSNLKIGDKVKADFLEIAQKHAAYQKGHISQKSVEEAGALEAMATAMKNLAESMKSKPNISGLERLSVPTWDGNRKTYATWKREFRHWMTKYNQDQDEQLQRFRKAMPKNFWWTDQVKTCKTIDQAWDILDREFADKRKLMDELLIEISSRRPVKRDCKSLAQYATTITGYVNDMEDNQCSVLNASEAPFFMSQLLSKLDTRDNIEFGREMQREKRAENVTNLIDWLHQEASLRSRGKQVPENEFKERIHRESPKKSDNHATSSGTTDDETCPLHCITRHLLAACPVYQGSTVNQRWEIVKQNKRCRKCLRGSHHTNDCRKPDGTSCDKCKKNHHRTLHNEKKDPQNSTLNPNASPFPSQGAAATSDQQVNSNSFQSNDDPKMEAKPATGLCPVQKVMVADSDGRFVEALAMLDTGSNTSLISKNTAKRLGLTGPQIHLTMNLAGGERKSEVSEALDITVASPTEPSIKKTFQVHTVRKPCSSPKTVSKKLIESYPHLKTISNKLHLSGGTVDLLIGTDLVDAFVDIHTISGEPGEPIAKRNCFGWYVMGQVAYSGDVRKMFNQVLVHPDDQVYHRFLWRNNTSEAPTVYQWLRLNFGDKPAPDIASNAINTLAKASQAEFPQAARDLQDHTYVDDVGGSKATLAEAKQITNGIDAILGKGQFQIKAWHSNHEELDQSNHERFTDLLGHRWDKQEDTFSFKKDAVAGKPEHFSKRSCLALLAQLWDPVGLIAPVTIKFRIQLQELWSSGYHWDDILPEGVQQKWMENVQAMNHLLTFEFDRKLKPSNSVGLPEVHGFCDGGELAYGAVIFLRWTLDDGSYHCVPFMIKPFVAPLKKKTIPRIELLGCLALSRIYETCQEALKFAEIKECKKVFWVDSSTALSWIRTPPRQFRPFVSARVAEIQETVGVEDFRYIRSKSNPADALTRGIDPKQLTSWLEGPSFLKLPDSEWPDFKEESQSSQVENKETLREKKPSEKNEVSSNRTTTSQKANVRFASQEEREDNPILSHLLKTCSTFAKARRTLAFVLRFVHNAMKKNVTKGPFSVQELKDAENQLFKWAQLHLEASAIHKTFFAKADQNGLLRAHGRLEDVRALPRDLRNPILLPRDHRLVELLLSHLHEKRGHCGYKSLIHEARKKFWIIGLRNMSKLITSKCVVCRKLRKKPLVQLMGQIPRLRVAAGLPAFSNTAMDMFGPLQIRLNRKTLKEAQVVIFTCMTTRAVHLELLTDKSSEVFLMAFRRFACLRGHPNICWSDCGTNFVGAQGYLREIMRGWNVPKIQGVLSEEFTCDFKWQWNIPRASHQNGVVETLIKSVRQALNSTCKNQAFTEEQWRTYLAEITYMINGRPLYPSSDDLWESPPITPNDILIGQHTPPPQPEPEARSNPRLLLRVTQNRVGDFWTCWLKYFAPNLLPRNKWFKTRENVEVGDLVLELDPNLKRNQWKMAIITETYPGNDGLVRKVRMKTKTGEYDRPIHKLCLIATKQELYAAPTMK